MRKHALVGHRGRKRRRSDNRPRNRLFTEPSPIILVDLKSKRSCRTGAHFVDHSLNFGRHLGKRRHRAAIVRGQHDGRCCHGKGEIR